MYSLLFIGIVLVAAAFVAGFMACFIFFSDKSLKAQYDNALRRLDDERAKTSWRLYQKQKPAAGEFCLIIGEDDSVSFGTFNEAGDDWMDKGLDGDVTYWLPFPEAKL